jgi:hypothetical protein
VLHHVPNHDDAYVLVVGNGKEWISSPEFNLRSENTTYVCAVLHDETTQVYVNGKAVADMNVSGGMAKSDCPLLIGDWQGLGRPFIGRVIETYLSSGELTPSGVAARWKSLH